MDKTPHAGPPHSDGDAGHTRKPYHPPTLTRWGDLADLTRGGGGTLKEQPSKGGSTFTRF